MARQPKLKQALKKEAAAEKKQKAAAQAAKAASKDVADPSLMPTPEDDKATVKNKAIEVIKRGLAKSQIQASGDAYIPEVWASKFKPLLGPYRRFVETCGAFKVVQGEIPCKFTVHRMDERLPTSKLVTGARWEVKLRAAWQKYLDEHKENARSPKEFVDFVRQVVEQKAKVSDRSKQRLQEHKAKRLLELQQRVAAEDDDDDDDDDDEEDEGEAPAPPPKKVAKKKR